MHHASKDGKGEASTGGKNAETKERVKTYISEIPRSTHSASRGGQLPRKSSSKETSPSCGMLSASMDDPRV